MYFIIEMQNTRLYLTKFWSLKVNDSLLLIDLLLVKEVYLNIKFQVNHIDTSKVGYQVLHYSQRKSIVS